MNISFRRPAESVPRRRLRGAVAEVFRRAILDSAEKVFRSEGFADAKMAKIAERAGVAAGTSTTTSTARRASSGPWSSSGPRSSGPGCRRSPPEAVDPRERLVRVTEATFDYME